MHADGAPRGSPLEDHVRLVVVDSPHVAAPLIGALDIADIGAWMWVEAEAVLYFSPRVLDLLDLALEPRADLIERFLQGVHPDDRDAVVELIEGRLPAGPFELRYRFTPPGGPLHWIESRGRVERSRTGELVRQGGAVRDVTREVGREQEQRESDARLEALVNAMPFAVWGRGGPGLSVTHQNAASVAMWGDIRGSAIGEAPDGVRDTWREQLAKVTTGQIVRSKQEFVVEGERRILQEILAPVVVGDQVTGAVGVAIDVTDEERARGRMQEAHKLESLGVLAGGIAHDFNNLLTAILGNASLLRMDYGGTPMAGPLDQIEAAARRAAELCRQMLAYAGRGRFALQPLDLNDLVRDMEVLLSLAVPTTATLEFDLAPALPPVIADGGQLRQLVTNLVINACEALHDAGGTITIRTSFGFQTARELTAAVLAPELHDGEYVTMSVSDTGEGMTPDTMSRIFDPFFSTRFTGRGLGLAAAVGIVRAHKGALRVESTPGSGSTFELLLPAHRGAAVVQAPSFGTAASSEPSGAVTGTVLVIDDELGVRSLARNVLEREGLTVLAGEDGESGIEIFRRNATDVHAVLVDLTMPGVDGRETLRQIREIRPDVPAILMSGYTPDDLDDSPGHEFLQKPFTPGALRAAIRRALLRAAE